jgi:hypothetical protein
MASSSHIDPFIEKYCPDNFIFLLTSQTEVPDSTSCKAKELFSPPSLEFIIGQTPSTLERRNRYLLNQKEPQASVQPTRPRRSPIARKTSNSNDPKRWSKLSTMQVQKKRSGKLNAIGIKI